MVPGLWQNHKYHKQYNMNYSVNIGGAERPLHFGFSCLAEYGRMSGLSLGQIGETSPENMSLQDILNLVYCGLKHGARKAGQKVDFTIDDVGDWLDEGRDLLAEVVKAFVESQKNKYGQEESDEGPGEKKS